MTAHPALLRTLTDRGWWRWIDTIQHCDALDLLRVLPDACVDCVVTSPPYNMGEHKHKWSSSKKSNWHQMKLRGGYATFDDDMTHDAYVSWQRTILSELLRVIRRDGAIFYVHKWRIMNKRQYQQEDILAGFPLRQCIIWDRGSGHNHNPAFFTPSFEVVYVLAGDAWTVPAHMRYLFDIWRVNPDASNPHPAPFPEALAELCIRSTTGPLVLDPFMGSGTTAAAARKWGRRFIGCDLSAEYVQIARDRLALPWQPSLFG
jgi:site-specific DNA-methyltransferase (adenine-specific)